MIAEDIVKKMEEMFGAEIVDPDAYPKQFSYQVKLAKWQLQFEAKNK
jgi:hypothetical protein